jgi:AsmA protein
MGRIFKLLLWLVGGFVTLFVLASVAIYLFFDPNDFREEISSSVKNQTGRDLTIAGDISLDVFPWLAVEVGESSLGNAPGFGDEPMASFERASFSVRLLPAILRREIVVGAADIESLRLNLEVNQSGVSNWEDLVPPEGTRDAGTSTASESGGRIDVNSIGIIDATIRYANRESGETISINQLNLKIGRLTGDGSDVPVEAAMQFDVQPSGLGGTLELDTKLAFNAANGELRLNSVTLDGTLEGVAAIPTTISLRTDGVEVSTNESLVTLQTVDLTALDMHIVADIEPLSYKDQVAPRATIAVETFSPRSLMQLFDVAPPETADPVALSRVTIDATAELTAAAIELSKVAISLDDTSFTGELSIPTTATGFYQFNLAGDSIDLSRYMEPADVSQSSASSDAAPIEIPADLIRPLNARGKFKLDKATVGNIVLENVDLGLNSSKGKMRVFPISSQLFGGTYEGDVRVDVSGDIPALSLNEKIAGVDLAKLAQAMFAKDNVTGAIDGSFVLQGHGNDMLAIQKDLSGNLSFELTDGTYVGMDIWYELRRARAALKGEQAPEAVLPATTAFSTVRMSGVVTDGIMRSDDLFAELPFMQLTGNGQVDIPAATVDYAMTARILEQPEFLSNATAEELQEFTEAVIPLKVSGPLASPSVQPDLDKLLRDRVEDEVKDLLKDKLKGLFD